MYYSFKGHVDTDRNNRKYLTDILMVFIPFPIGLDLNGMAGYKCMGWN